MAFPKVLPGTLMACALPLLALDLVVHTLRIGDPAAHLADVRASVEAANLDGTCIVLARSWRPEGEALPDGIEGIPGYHRPDDWKQIQDAEGRAPGRLEMDGNTFWSK